MAGLTPSQFGTAYRLGAELEALAVLFVEVLSATETDGQISSGDLQELDNNCKRSWERWTQLLNSSSYEKWTASGRTDIEELITISRGASGLFVSEIYLLRVSLANGRMFGDLRKRLAASVSGMRNKAIEMQRKSVR
ncbi:hypothetical protein CJD38_17770 [Stenotrophobium rhamnosiphilum]|uniref:Uncharacterized protein n=1 Tax=Stenotrophobium rhamnosiphilum TaxID=2029166 RepID=A0A2T5MB94_9GAMM|nr:hypothetical protein CJD38_17770 [Stenotrophobium rhamnosiphilum]